MVESGGILGDETKHTRPARRREHIAIALIAASICLLSVIVLTAEPAYSVRDIIFLFGLSRSHP